MARARSRLGNTTFITFKQALEAGGHVRKGEHGTKVYFVKQLQVKDGDRKRYAACSAISRVHRV